MWLVGRAKNCRCQVRLCLQRRHRMTWRPLQLRWQSDPTDGNSPTSISSKITRIRILGETESASVLTKEPSSSTKPHHYPHTVTESSSHPSRSSSKRAHLVYRARYRGKNVVVKKCFIPPPTTTVNVNNGVASLKSPNGAPSAKHGRTGPSNGSREISIPSDMTASDNAALGALLRRCASVRHPNLALFMGAYVEYDHVGIVEEEVSRGSLAHLLASSTILEWEQSLQILLDTASAMASLEAMEMVHPDLCTKRLLVTTGYRVKVSGYGFVCLERKLQEMIQSRALREGTLSPEAQARVYETRINLWSSPETFDQDDPLHTLTYDPSAKSMKSNTYSFGMIIWSVICRRVPYDGKFGPKLRQKIRDGFRLPVPNSVTPRFKALIKSCWAGDVSRRPTFRDIHSALLQIKAEGPPVIKLDETNSKMYRKAATVFAYASKDPITILKDTGKNRGMKMNFLVASSTKPPAAALHPNAEYWSSFTDLTMMDPDVFARTYEPTGVHENEYRKIGTVRARKMDEPFAIRTGVTVTSEQTPLGLTPATTDTSISGASNGLIEQGVAGDYVCQNEAGDQWVADGKTMEAVYTEVRTPGQEDPTPPPLQSPSSDGMPNGNPFAASQASLSKTTDVGGVNIQLVGLGGGAMATTYAEPPTPIKITEPPVAAQTSKPSDPPTSTTKVADASTISSPTRDPLERMEEAKSHPPTREAPATPIKTVIASKAVSPSPQQHPSTQSPSIKIVHSKAVTPTRETVTSHFQAQSKSPAVAPVASAAVPPRPKAKVIVVKKTAAVADSSGIPAGGVTPHGKVTRGGD